VKGINYTIAYVYLIVALWDFAGKGHI
jgi:hypothetical protein